MKTTNFLRAAGLIMLMGFSAGVYAQGRGHGKGHDKHYGNDHRGDRGGRHDHHDHHYEASRRDVYVHHHYHSAPVERRVVHYYRERPRYVYYRDYDVYYDYHRSVYITLSGRNWVLSTSMPTAMCHVDVRRTNHVAVDYYDDDFPGYLDRGRPTYFAYSGWEW